MNTDPTISASSDLLSRVAHECNHGNKQISLLVGSGLTTPHVPGVDGTLNLAQDLLSEAPEDVAQLSRLDRDQPGSTRYSQALDVLFALRGQDFINGLVRKAVLEAWHGSDCSTWKHGIPDDNECNRIEHKVSDWSLPAGVISLADLLVHYPSFRVGSVLTTNFDPLIEVAIRFVGGNPIRTFLHTDGRVDQTLSDNGQLIFHLHGYWTGDTLHSRDQLTRPRPQLEGSIQSLLRNHVLLVVGYGGWNDVFTRALTELIRRSEPTFDVLWTFFETDDQTIRVDNAELIADLASHRVCFYSGVDSNQFFPRLCDHLDASSVVPERFESWIRKLAQDRQFHVLAEFLASLDRRRRRRILGVLNDLVTLPD